VLVRTSGQNKATDFNAVQHCVAKSLSCIARAFPFPKFQGRCMPGKKRRLFFGQGVAAPTIPTGVAGTQRLPPYLRTDFLAKMRAQDYETDAFQALTPDEKV
jgi:hypothetical protein